MSNQNAWPELSVYTESESSRYDTKLATNITFNYYAKINSPARVV